MARLVKGDVFPNFIVDTVYIEEMSIRDIVNNQPTMFIVLRYIGCTVCRYDIHLLEMRYQEFLNKGINVVVVMQSTQEIVQHDLAGRVLPFHIICDVNQKIYKELS